MYASQALPGNASCEALPNVSGCISMRQRLSKAFRGRAT